MIMTASLVLEYNLYTQAIALLAHNNGEHCIQQTVYIIATVNSIKARNTAITSIQDDGVY